MSYLIGATRTGQALNCKDCGTDLSDKANYILLGRISRIGHNAEIKECRKCGNLASEEFRGEGFVEAERLIFER